MPQGLGLNLYDNLSVAENIAFFRDLRQVPVDVYESNRIKLLDMTRLSPFLGRQARHLSGGMRQKLALICTLIHLPDILLLDEPTTGVDPISRQDFWMIIHRLVRERQVTVLLATSYMDEAERCDRLGLMHQGHLIACDTPANLKSASERRSGSLIAVRTSDFRRAFDLIISLFPKATLYGSRIHSRTFAPETDKTKVLTFLKDAGITDVEVSCQPLTMEV